MKNKLVPVGWLGVFLLIFGGCGGSKPVTKTAKTAASSQSAVSEPAKLAPVSKDDLTKEELAQVTKILEELKDIQFNFDSYEIPTEGIEAMRKNVDILNNTLERRGKYIEIVMEGHTDQRGSDEYNLALGDRRAKAVRDYLLNVGFKGRSLKILSYGEERPKVQGNNLEAWAANRRVHLEVP